MVIDLLQLVGGFVLLILGGEWLVRGSVGLARVLGVSTLLISLTVVAFGTSAPELAVNILAAIDGNAGINFGNIIGSNIANIGLVLGLTAVVRPVRVDRSVILREIPLMLVATAVTAGLALDHVHHADRINQLSRIDGLILLILFAGFLLYNIRNARHQRHHRDAFSEEVEAEKMPACPPVGRAVVFTLIGLVGVVAGGELVQDGAVGLAVSMGVSQTIIGLTIVAIGTSLPELATCLIAVRHGHTNLAVGNVVGSNIWNLLLILAVSILIGPFALPAGGVGDLIVMAVLAVVILPLSISQRRIGRLEGGALLGLYGLYLTMRCLDVMHAGSH